MIRLFVFTCLTLICSNVAALHFTVLPDATSELADDFVDMNCSLGTQKVTFLYSIRIAKQGQSSPLATILPGDRTIVHDPSNSVVVNGHVDHDAPDTSYLHLRWSDPMFQNSGVYTCEITYLDLKEKTNRSKSVVKLTVRKTVDMHDIVLAILRLRDQRAQRDEEIETLSQENKNLQKSLKERDSISKINSQLLKDMRERLNNAQRKSVERESITDATKKILLENTNSLNILAKKVNKLIDVNNKCPDGWKRFRNQCFITHLKKAITWQQAKDHCNSLGAHLPEIPDAPTNEFIYTMVKGATYYVWLGLNDVRSEGEYVWDWSSRPGNYTNWASTQPNTNDGKDYAYMFPNTGKWGTFTSGAERSYICERTLVLI